MKIAQTLEGGLRIDPTTPEDWYILRAIIFDANRRETDLATRLGGMVSDEGIAEDWRDIVVPDLRESFADDINRIQAAIETAAAFPKDGQHPIWITRDEALTWYSALNQARLALEEIHRFESEPDPENDSQVRHEALMRSRIYGELQSYILQHVL